jgi:NAD-dependent SIR2 family protein deacetylase
MKVTATAECVACKHRKDFGPDDVERDEVPLCPQCFSPMVAVSAEAKPVKR